MKDLGNKERLNNKKSFLFKLTAISLSFIIFIIFLELFARLFIFGFDGLSLSKINSTSQMGVSGLIKASASSEIVYELKPNLKAVFKMVPLETNSKGLADREYPIAKPEKSFRTVVIGDSFTMPSGTKVEESYHSLIEERLNKKGSQHSYEFINFAVGGYSLRQYLGVLREKALLYDPDLILIGFCPLNDHLIYKELFSPERKPFKPKKTTKRYLESFAMKLIYRSFMTIRGTWGSKKIMTLTPDEHKYVDNIFSEFKTIGKTNDIPVVVAFIDIVKRDPSTLRELARKNGLHFVDLTAPFEGKKLSDYRIYAIDNHPNSDGHRVLAETLYSYFLKERLIPEADNY